ncbi:MAG: hypothetical protein AEth_00946 [Candidatus Argoarchaeum ethanivorans]|uniref:Uncharacterized protein n=1 Tax=Candidatus Argoarchaeum ethanivorans TaxID=2608793 RepID=A0A8B3S3L9_9EURY|nr:MAG: hypothetical protein AEth_00946 [Candidatus Argoarchaeum ethanivorans]
MKHLSMVKRCIKCEDTSFNRAYLALLLPTLASQDFKAWMLYAKTLETKVKDA